MSIHTFVSLHIYNLYLYIHLYLYIYLYLYIHLYLDVHLYLYVHSYLDIHSYVNTHLLFGYTNLSYINFSIIIILGHTYNVYNVRKTPETRYDVVAGIPNGYYDIKRPC